MFLNNPFLTETWPNRWLPQLQQVQRKLQKSFTLPYIPFNLTGITSVTLTWAEAQVSVCMHKACLMVAIFIYRTPVYSSAGWGRQGLSTQAINSSKETSPILWLVTYIHRRSICSLKSVRPIHWPLFGIGEEYKKRLIYWSRNQLAVLKTCGWLIQKIPLESSFSFPQTLPSTVT